MTLTESLNKDILILYCHQKKKNRNFQLPPHANTRLHLYCLPLSWTLLYYQFFRLFKPFTLWTSLPPHATHSPPSGFFFPFSPGEFSGTLSWFNFGLLILVGYLDPGISWNTTMLFVSDSPRVWFSCFSLYELLRLFIILNLSGGCPSWVLYCGFSLLAVCWLEHGIVLINENSYIKKFGFYIEYTLIYFEILYGLRHLRNP